jgi:type I restriction enzyme S subunit
MDSEAPLADACSLIADCPHNTAPESDTAYAFAVGTKAITNGRIDFTQARAVSVETYAAWTVRAVPEPGDLILCREAPVGPTAIVPASPRVCLGQRTVLLRPDQQRVIPEYLLYALLSPRIQASLRELSEGSTVAHLNVAEIRRFRVSLPPLEEQRRIVGVLGALDGKIDSNRRLAGWLEESAATLFRARFVDFVGVEEFEDSELGPIPHGWRSGELGEIGAVHRQPVRGPSDLPYVGLDSMPRKSTILAEWLSDGAPQGQAWAFDVGDILFGKLRPYFHKVAVAPIGGRCSTEILVVRPRQPALFGVLLGHVASSAFIDYCVSVSRGTRMPRAEWADAQRFAIAIPPIEVAAEFARTSRTLYEQVRSCVHESITLASIRDALLPKLISGDIRVPDSRDVAEVIEPMVA